MSVEAVFWAVLLLALLLMWVADPGNPSGALESSGYKQLPFEPVLGGGLFTGSSVALIAAFGKEARANRRAEREVGLPAP
jgi:glutamate:Na+ symporter, ESS family